MGIRSLYLLFIHLWILYCSIPSIAYRVCKALDNIEREINISYFKAFSLEVLDEYTCISLIKIFH